MKVSVVIATHNRCSDLKKCIDSLSTLDANPYEIIVVDSNSTDGTVRLKDNYPIKYMSIERKNRQAARNAGISVAKGKIVAFLDDDVVVDEEWLKSLLQCYNESDVGGVGGRVIPYGEPKTFFHPVKHSDIGKVRKNGMVLGNFDTPAPKQIEVDTLQGCNMSFKKELLLKVDGFDETFEGNCFRDDTDLCLRVRNLGYRLMYQPKALVWHAYKGGIADKSWIYWYVRNNTYFYLKNIFPEAKSFLPLFLIRQYFPPRDYARKSGVKVKLSAATPFIAVKGLADGLSQSLAHKRQMVQLTR